MDSSVPGDFPHSSKDDMLELNKQLEKMIEDVEKIAVQLSWLSYDMVALRTSPELGAGLQKMEEAYHRCRDAVCAGPDKEPEMNSSTETADV
ncbi:synaptonemal complex central element protein 3 [Thalassophryne amazonica]|uniref:synaptonemal complex central element protein 3 n=1 Tax=Thalassophryne amazonica TaxID=390379 RepID=UPI001470AD24|nr:synaptonemal complex central element protein 3 [Thalassophryne amazonica]